MGGNAQIRVAIDVGMERHWVGIAGPDGTVAEEFAITHDGRGFEEFFRRVERRRGRRKLPVAVAMEGYNGWARPLDGMIQRRGWELLNVNNLKLARYKEIFPGPAKSDPMDVGKMLELFRLQEALPLAKNVLQRVERGGEAERKLKRLTRRRRQLVEEKVAVANRLLSDLQAVCPELAALTGDVANRWFAGFLCSRDGLRKLARMQRRSLLKIKGIGAHYAQLIESWQKGAAFSDEVDWVGPMIQTDAARILQLLDQIRDLEGEIAATASQSRLARRIAGVPGFGNIGSAELAAEIGTVDRFEKEASLALYLGMTGLDNDSGKREGVKPARHVNRRAKRAMMTCLARHIDRVPESKRYYNKKRDEGKDHNQAIRALGRHMVRVLWKMLTEDRDYEIRD